MIHQLYSVYDRKAKVFCKPFTAENHEVAVRSFAFAANDKTTDIGRYPEDFVLYHLGSFDDNSAAHNLVEPESLIPALSCLGER